MKDNVSAHRNAPMFFPRHLQRRQWAHLSCSPVTGGESSPAGDPVCKSSLAKRTSWLHSNIHSESCKTAIYQERLPSVLSSFWSVWDLWEGLTSSSLSITVTDDSTKTALFGRSSTLEWSSRLNTSSRPIVHLRKNMWNLRFKRWTCFLEFDLDNQCTLRDCQKSWVQFFIWKQQVQLPTEMRGLTSTEKLFSWLWNKPSSLVR